MPIFCRGCTCCTLFISTPEASISKQLCFYGIPFVFLNRIVYFCSMNRMIEILKGLHPGLFLQRELGNRKLKSGQFAESIGEHPQTLSAIIRGRRSMNTPLSLRIEQALGLEEGFLMTLQVYYDIAEEKRKLSQSHRPDITKFRSTIFWDTKIENIDFIAHSRYVINRVFERGNEEEINEIIRFYGKAKIIENITLNSKSPFEKVVQGNLKKYMDYGT